MEWILDHLQLVIFIAIAVAASLQRMKKAAGGDSARRQASTGPEEDERTRRIQEEIRRRILERRGLAPVAEADDSESRAFPAAPPRIEEVRPVRVEAPVATVADETMDAEYRRQQEMIERARVALEEARKSRAAVAAAPGSAAAEATDRALPDLHSRGGLRRAVVLREVLGPPIGLR